MELTYRELKIVEAQEMSNFEKKVYGEKEGWGTESIRTYFQKSNLTPFFVNLNGSDETIGLVAYTLENNKAWIATNAVVKEYRRRGISTQMLEWCFKIIRDKGFQEVSLFVKVDNAPAVQMYKKIGFVFNAHQEKKDRMIMTLKFKN